MGKDSVDKSLMDAAWSGDCDALVKLIQNGACAGYTRHDGRTPLMLASERGHTQVSPPITHNTLYRATIESVWGCNPDPRTVW